MSGTGPLAGVGVVYPPSSTLLTFNYLDTINVTWEVDGSSNVSSLFLLLWVYKQNNAERAFHSAISTNSSMLVPLNFVNAVQIAAFEVSSDPDNISRNNIPGGPFNIEFNANQKPVTWNLASSPSPAPLPASSPSATTTTAATPSLTPATDSPIVSTTKTALPSESIFTGVAPSNSINSSIESGTSTKSAISTKSATSTTSTNADTPSATTNVGILATPVTAGSDSSTKSIGTGALAAIVIGAVAIILVLLTLGTWAFLRSRRKRQSNNQQYDAIQSLQKDDKSQISEASGVSRSELQGFVPHGPVGQQPRHEIDTKFYRHEMSS